MKLLGCKQNQQKKTLNFYRIPEQSFIRKDRKMGKDAVAQDQARLLGLTYEGDFTRFGELPATFSFGFLFQIYKNLG